MSKVFDDKARRKYGLVSNFLYNMSAASFLATLLPSRLAADLTARMEISRMVPELALFVCSRCLYNNILLSGVF
ncbi:hypothetical protein [Acetatifactor aquisgranensis]|uniref:hypothetical protein n=1 Tax=Acetatifactor aquisgranensis TaxID=2941233 RepID=UPI00203BF30E|nr:hypothetical protein [Acetatifactor aquisgranensis]MCI8542646.1 hypothetical protein [Lachnospiraceae bacterium]